MGKIVHTKRIITISIFVNSYTYSDRHLYLVVNIRQQIHVMALPETKICEGGPKNNWNLNVARELEVVARCAARCRESTNTLAVCRVASV
jgi:hypothetical protein